MRIVIDLQACQNGAAYDRSGALALAQALAAHNPVHPVFIAFSERNPESIDELRQAFAGLLPASQLLTYATPAADSPWQKHAAVELRLGFLASLSPDVVFVPGLLDHKSQTAIYGVVPHALNVLAVGDSTTLLGGANAPLLQDYALIVANGEAERRRLATATGAVPLVALPSAPSAASAAAASAAADAATALLEACAALLPGGSLPERTVSAAAASPATSATPASSSAKPRLAYVSPLPPEKSGIADYSAEVIAEIDQFYDVELIVTPGVEAASLASTPLAKYPVRSAEWFAGNAGEYDRIVYHFGNSNVHKHMFALLERHPGIVVLHDFYLSGVLDNMERDGDVPGAFMQALYASHGYTGIQHHTEHTRNPTIWAYPLNRQVLDNAAGIIVHSDFSKRLAERWYGPGAADGWITLPLLRGQGADKDPAQARQQARAALGIRDDEFIVSTFGMLGSTKLNARLLDAFLASPLAQDPRARLVFVGENDAGPYGYELERQISQSPARDRIRITGFASTADYANWLAASDAAVQLRAQTRGETSASVLDCLLHGVPTIINAHGAAADLPNDVLVKLDDEFATEDLTAALASLRSDAQRRGELSRSAREFIRREHSPAQVGRLYHEAIEGFARRSRHAAHKAMLAGLARSGAPRAPNEAGMLAIASMIASNRAVQGQKQLLVDISALVQTDHKTGIQRVVRSVLLALIKNPPPGYRVEPVYSEGSLRPYRYARRFTFAMLGGQAPQLEDAPIDAHAGDIFLGLDLASNITTQNEPMLLKMRRRGVKIWFVIYDLLPLLRPEAFAYGTQKYYGDYIDTITLVADGVASISHAVSDELAGWLSSHANRRATPLQLGYFHLGADINASAPSTGLPDNAAVVMQAVKSAPTLLMVGTLEPRKGQLQALDAFELLWADGIDANLVIVGKHGWMMESLVKRLESHPQRERRLFWLPGVSDEMLLKLYESSAALLAASEGEGFGLPLIEAAQHKLPIIARGLPVFREVAGEHAYYFEGKEPQALADAIRSWLDLHKAGKAPQSARMPWLTWEQSARQLVDVTVNGNTHGQYAAGRVAPQLLVDVSAVARDDLKTGIQRVVRAQLFELLRAPTTEFQVRPIYLTDEGGRWHYRYARRYEHALLGTDSYGVVDDDVRVAAGDVFYSPDFFPGAVTEAAETGLYTRWRSAGVSVNFLIHDLLPVLRPEFFPPRTDDIFERWLSAVSAHSDRLVCISAAVADETRDWLQRTAPDQPLPELAVVHHGADIDASSPSTGMPDDAERVLADIASAPSFLMVGTIEPRKGHLQALDAFDQMWAAGEDVRLVIVGGEGWKGVPDSQRRSIPAIMKRLASHPELGRRLHWLKGISDEYLDAVYRSSACLLSPSEGEGFGLPLIEAARHGLPVIARDIPVFREVAQEHASYFNGSSGADLAGAVRGWLQQKRDGQVAASSGMPWQTWSQNAQQLAAILFRKA